MKLFSAVALTLSSTACLAGISVADLGTGAPPATLGVYSITLFPPDGTPEFTPLTDVASPLGGNVTFDIAAEHRIVGSSWATWSHGYLGDIYFAPNVSSLTISLPASTGAFVFYVEGDALAEASFTATANDGASLTLAILGNAGANGFGFYSDGITPLTSITLVNNSGGDFAVGEFGISADTGAVPEASTWVSGMVLVALGGWVAGRRRASA